jgi:hypothetical protein
MTPEIRYLGKQAVWVRFDRLWFKLTSDGVVADWRFTDPPEGKEVPLMDEQQAITYVLDGLQSIEGVGNKALEKIYEHFGMGL